MTTSKLSDLIGSVRKEMEGLARAGLFTLWLAGKPVTASRPRFSKQGFAYTAKPYRDWMNAQWKAVEAMDPAPTDRPVALLIEVGIMRPKSTKHSAPLGDTDNLSKGPMDLVTKGGKAWLDDRQIVFQVTAKRWVNTEEELGSRLYWCEVEME